MNIVFMGTPDFAVPALNSIAKAGHHISGVVTQPDKPKGRGKEVRPTPVKEFAMELNIPVYQPEKVEDKGFIEQLRKLAPDVIVVIAFGQLLPKEIIDMPKYGCINIHASLLPGYRGAAPIQWVIINGEQRTGVTTMRMDYGLDTGDMLDKVEITIEGKETGGSLHDKLAAAGAALIISTLNDLENGRCKPEKQEDSFSSYAGMLHKGLGDIDFSMDAVKIERLIRGLNPWPSAYTTLNGKTLKLWEADVIEKEYEGNNGEIVEITNRYIIVKTKKNALGITQLQLEGKKRMHSGDFLRGFPLIVGQRFGAQGKITR